MSTESPALIAQKIVKEAGQFLMANFEKVQTVSFKGKGDIVTQADLGAEEIITQALAKYFPDHSVLSEEAGLHDNHSKYIWIVDPLDGSINYYHGSSPFRVGLCLLENKAPILTAVYNPLKDMLYFAEKGRGATLNGRPISVNANDDITRSIVMTHLSSHKTPRARTILALENIFSHTMHMRMFGSGLAAMSYVASGKFDVFFNVKTSPWDILPGALLIQEAGGTATDIKGGKITYKSTSVLATNGLVHRKMLGLLENI